MSEGETVRFPDLRKIQVCVRFHPQRVRLMARVAKVILVHLPPPLCYHFRLIAIASHTSFIYTEMEFLKKCKLQVTSIFYLNIKYTGKKY